MASRYIPSRIERMYKHVLESNLERGKSLKMATRIAAATVNKYRAKLAKGYKVCKKRVGKKVCRRFKGPKLVTKGGSRRQWYPGKATAFRKRHHKL